MRPRSLRGRRMLLPVGVCLGLLLLLLVATRLLAPSGTQRAPAIPPTSGSGATTTTAPRIPVPEAPPDVLSTRNPFQPRAAPTSPAPAPSPAGAGVPGRG